VPHWPPRLRLPPDSGGCHIRALELQSTHTAAQITRRAPLRCLWPPSGGRPVAGNPIVPLPPPEQRPPTSAVGSARDVHPIVSLGRGRPRRSRGAAGSRRRWRAGATSAVYHQTDSWRCERSAFCILGGARPQEARPIRELKEDATTNSSGGYRHTGWQAPVPACGSHVVIAAANETRPRSRRADGGIAPVNPRPRASVTPRSWTGGGLGGPDRCQ